MTDPIVTPAPSAPAPAPAAPAPAPATPAPAPAAPAAADPISTPAPAPIETRAVPLPVMEKLRSELQAAKQSAAEAQRQAQLYNEQIALYRANMPAPQQQAPAPMPQAQAAAVADLLDGMKDDQLLEAGQVRKALAALSQQQEQKIQSLVQQALGQLQPKLTALELAQENPQFKQIMKEQLPALIQEQPWVAELIKSLPREKQLATAAQFAMLRARSQAAAQPAAPMPAAAPPANLMDELNRIIENQAKPGNPGAAGGIPATSLSMADRIAKMTSAEFADYKAQVLSGKVSL